MFQVKTILFVFIMTILGGVYLHPLVISEQESYEKSYALWKNHHIKDYAYTIKQ